MYHSGPRETPKITPSKSEHRSAETVLYISYDGLTDALGRTQVLPYVLGLADRGWKMAVLSFEKPGRSRQDRLEVARQLSTRGVVWLPHRYHQYPAVPATAFDIAVGVAASLRHRLGAPVGLIHARSYIAATMGLALKRVLRASLLFDMRGFWADERVESGAWPTNGKVYKSVKVLEQRLFGAADAVVSLTHAGRRVLEQWELVGGRGVPVEVIPTCADLQAYARIADLDRAGPLTLGYVGSLGGRYLIDETVRFFKAFLGAVPETRFEVLTPREQDPLWEACGRHGLDRLLVSAAAVRSNEVPSRLARMHATVSLIKPGFASLASCPTKFGESLAAGVPVVVNRGIGDCAEIVERERVGVVLEDGPTSQPGAVEALRRLLADGPVTRRRCLDTARKYLALADGVDSYDRLYGRMLERRRGQR